MSSGPLKTVKFTVIPGQAGQLKLFPSSNSSGGPVTHTVLAELRVEEGADIQLEDAVDLLVAESPSSCYLMVSGVIRYEV